MSAPTISIAMATYNGAHYLQEQLESLKAQSYAPLELVVHDDRSYDKTVEIIEEFALTAPFEVRIFVNEHNLGHYGNFLRCAASCSGEYIAFCDQDDIWAQTKLERFADAVQRDNVVLVAHSAKMISASNEDMGRLHDRPDAVYQNCELFPWDFFFGFTCCFRRSLLDLYPMELRPRDIITAKQKLAHDRWVCFLASSSGGVRFIAQDLAMYRQHESNESSWMRQGSGIIESVRKAQQRTGFHFLKLADIAESLASVTEELTNRAVDDTCRLNFQRSNSWWSRQSCAARTYVRIFSIDSKVRRIASIMRNRETLYFGEKSYAQRTKALLHDVVLACIAGKHQIERGKQILCA